MKHLRTFSLLFHLFDKKAVEETDVCLVEKVENVMLSRDQSFVRRIVGRSAKMMFWKMLKLKDSSSCTSNIFYT